MKELLLENLGKEGAKPKVGLQRMHEGKKKKRKKRRMISEKKSGAAPESLHGAQEALRRTQRTEQGDLAAPYSWAE